MALLTFGIEPGGEQLDGGLCPIPTGEVLRARGDTGVCLLLLLVPPPIMLASLCLNESERCGEDGCLGEGVPLDECPGLSRVRPLLLRLSLLKNDCFLLLRRPLLERWRSIFPIRCPREGVRFFLSFWMLVCSRGMVLIVITVFFLSTINETTCTCCSPVMASPLMCVIS